MLTSTDFRGLLNQRFFNNLLPVPSTNQFKQGTLAPPFQLLDVQSGHQVRLSDFTGHSRPGSEAPKRPVLLAFTRIFTEKQYCPLCFPHTVALNKAYDQFRARGADVLLITSTDPKQSQIVAQDLGLNMPFLSDPSCRVFRAYQTGQALGAPLPAQFVVDSAGKLRFRHLFSFLSPNADIERLLSEVDRVMN
ncbi:MAG: peroxiredoxin family protein [Elainellaceae cyanobacterium]